tara:strand:- start:110 stop:409 length:300 start_codon:yes stop_codon:yes gene_type:complete
MSMPKGFKSENGYASSKLLGGKTYHEISSIMLEKGYKMNHSTARNVFVCSLMKIAAEILGLYELKMNEKQIKKIAIDPRFQDAIKQFMCHTNEYSDRKF